jgi:hypothetical protein
MDDTRFKKGQRVLDAFGGPFGRIDTVEITQTGRPGSAPFVRYRVEWDDGTLTWEHPSDIVEVEE